MGGKSQDNSEITRQQEEQAAEARAKDEARKVRINAGLEAIKNAFMGKATYTTRATPGTVLGASGALPAGYTRFQSGGTTSGGSNYMGPGSEYSGGRQSGNDSFANTNRRTTGTTTGGVWKVRGPDGRVYNIGDTVGGGSEQVFTGREAGGFDDAYYNEYNEGVKVPLMQQVADQYIDAKEKSEYDLARARTSKSSAANKVMADLTKQKENAETDVQQTADTATGALRSRVAKEQAALENQLYATENPNADAVLAAVKNISLDTPAIGPLGDVFKTALVGGANAITGFKNQQTVNDVRRAAADAAKVYPS